MAIRRKKIDLADVNFWTEAELNIIGTDHYTGEHALNVSRACHKFSNHFPSIDRRSLCLVCGVKPDIAQCKRPIDGKYCFHAKLNEKARATAVYFCKGFLRLGYSRKAIESLLNSDLDYKMIWAELESSEAEITRTNARIQLLIQISKIVKHCKSERITFADAFEIVKSELTEPLVTLRNAFLKLYPSSHPDAFAFCRKVIHGCYIQAIPFEETSDGKRLFTVTCKCGSINKVPAKDLYGDKYYGCSAACIANIDPAEYDRSIIELISGKEFKNLREVAEYFNMPNSLPALKHHYLRDRLLTKFNGIIIAEYSNANAKRLSDHLRNRLHEVGLSKLYRIPLDKEKAEKRLAEFKQFYHSEEQQKLRLKKKLTEHWDEGVRSFWTLRQVDEYHEFYRSKAEEVRLRTIAEDPLLQSTAE